MLDASFFLIKRVGQTLPNISRSCNCLGSTNHYSHPITVKCSLEIFYSLLRIWKPRRTGTDKWRTDNQTSFLLLLCCEILNQYLRLFFDLSYQLAASVRLLWIYMLNGFGPLFTFQSYNWRSTWTKFLSSLIHSCRCRWDRCDLS